MRNASYYASMFGLGMGEILLILVVALLALGPDKLPDAAKAIGKGIRDFRRSTSDLKKTLEEDSQLGDAVREIRSALHSDPLRPQPPPPPNTATKPPAQPGVDGPEPTTEAPAESDQPYPLDEEGLPIIKPPSTSVASGSVVEEGASAATDDPEKADD